MPHHRDAHRGQLLGVLDHATAAFHLHRGDAGFLQKTPGISDRVLGGGVVGHERHIADDQCAGRAADHGTGVTDHVVHRHAEGVGVAEHRRSQAVADQQHRDAGAIQPARRAVVVAGQHREPGAFGEEPIEALEFGIALQCLEVPLDRALVAARRGPRDRVGRGEVTQVVDRAGEQRRHALARRLGR